MHYTFQLISLIFFIFPSDISLNVFILISSRSFIVFSPVIAIDGLAEGLTDELGETLGLADGETDGPMLGESDGLIEGDIDALGD